MERRVFIKLSAFTAAAISVPLLNSCNENPINKAVAEPIFLSRLFDYKTIPAMGQAYLEKVPAEKSENKLSELLSDKSPIAESSDVNAIHSYLDKKVHRDFETGKTVIVKGWVLSLTEIRQCALFSLINKA